LDISIGDKLIFKRVDEAKGFFKRLRGLMLKKSSKPNNILFIRRCNWIHTFFMKFPISVVYLGKNNVVLEIDPLVMPWKICKPRLKASHVLEFEADSKKLRTISKGEVLKCIV
jgi:uncharacterized protein